MKQSERTDAIREYAEQRQAETGALPSARDVARTVGGDTRVILSVLREVRGDEGATDVTGKPGARDEECREALRIVIPNLLWASRYGFSLSRTEREELEAAMRAIEED